jgi:hypothetical protein
VEKQERRDLIMCGCPGCSLAMASFSQATFLRVLLRAARHLPLNLTVLLTAPLQKSVARLCQKSRVPSVAKVGGLAEAGQKRGGRMGEEGGLRGRGFRRWRRQTLVKPARSHTHLPSLLHIRTPRIPFLSLPLTPTHPLFCSRIPSHACALPHFPTPGRRGSGAALAGPRGQPDRIHPDHQTLELPETAEPRVQVRKGGRPGGVHRRRESEGCGGRCWGGWGR